MSAHLRPLSVFCVILMVCFGTEALAQFATKTPTSPAPTVTGAGSPSTRTLTADFPPSREVIYKTVANAKLRMAIFDPAKDKVKGKAPVIVFFFGGDWRTGHPSQFYPECVWFAERGFLACTAEYRTARSGPAFTPFDCVSDGKSAIRWLRRHAAEYGGDPARIVAAGASVGGHVAACTALIAGFDDPADDVAVSCVPNALVLLSAVVDTTREGSGFGLLGERGLMVSPAHHVARGAPPTILFHGTADRFVKLENAERFARVMREAGNVCELVKAEGQGQGYFNHPAFWTDLDPKWFNETMQKTYDFLAKQGIVQALPAAREPRTPAPSPAAKSK